MTVDQITDLASTATWRQALNAMLAACDLLDDASAVTTVATALIALLDDELPDRDQPARQRLSELAARLQSRLGASDVLRGAATEVADLLAPVAAATAVELAGTAVPWEDIETVTAALLHVALLADRPLLAQTAQRAVTAGLSRVLTRLESAEPQRAARALIDAGAPTAALIGLGIVQVAGRTTSWQEPWSSWLHELRGHDDADVRAAALATFTTPE